MTVFGIPHIRTYESTHLRLHSIHTVEKGTFYFEVSLS